MKKFKTNADLDYACRQLAAQDARLAHVYETYGVPTMRRGPMGFAGLVRILIAQQVSTAAATAIQGRVDALLPETTPQAWLALDDAALVACGVSAPKRRYLSGLAEAVLDERLVFSALHRAENKPAHEMLTALSGIGPWTADCYLLFNMCRADCFPAGDLALQEGYRLLYCKNKRPDAAQLTIWARDWSPLRAAAARLLWVYYGQQRQKV